MSSYNLTFPHVASGVQVLMIHQLSCFLFREPHLTRHTLYRTPFQWVLVSELFPDFQWLPEWHVTNSLFSECECQLDLVKPISEQCHRPECEFLLCDYPVSPYLWRPSLIPDPSATITSSRTIYSVICVRILWQWWNPDSSFSRKPSGTSLEIFSRFVWLSSESFEAFPTSRTCAHWLERSTLSRFSLLRASCSSRTS